MFVAHGYTPVEYNENEFVSLVQKKTCCWKRYVPTLFFLFRGLQNLGDFYKDIHYAVY
jgi:hypothetical protein